MVEWKHHQAERDVAPLLNAAEAVDPDVVHEFPRPVVEILSASVPALEVHREVELDLERIVQILRDEHAIYAEQLVADGNERVGGFTYADSNRLIIFVETKFGPEFEAFTLAHETGHIVKELLPLHSIDLTTTESLELLRDETGAPELVVPRKRPLRARRPRVNPRVREAIANTIAAELLAPWREVERIALAAELSQDAVDVVRDCFGLSRRSARIRLMELHLLAPDDLQSR